MSSHALQDKLRLLSKLPEGHVLLQILDHYRQTANARLRAMRGDDLIAAQGFAKAIDELESDIRAAGRPAQPAGPSRRVVEATLESARGM